MSIERLNGLLARLRQELESTPAGSGTSRFAPALARELLESMLLARHLDIAALELRARGAGHYTIGSAGHESNVVLGRLTRLTDPTLVHYRSAALQLERSRQASGTDGVRDIALSLVASRDEPVSGGRHKVFGGTALGIIPQTSTIASHLPRAVGLAYALGWKKAQQLGEEPADAVVVCSFGDASVNHSTALGAFNAAGWVAHQSLPLPLLFVCEDNGLGVSVRSPPGWTRARLESLPHVRYFAADGTDVEACFDVTEAALSHCRATRRPAVLHLSCVRLAGHAGSDVDTTYRSRPELEAVAERDPVWCAARDFVARGVLSASDVLELERAAQARVSAEAERAVGTPRLTSRAQVAESLARPIPAGFAAKARPAAPTEAMTLAQGVSYALAEILRSDPGSLLFGEDVARKGGVYGATKGLLDRFGHARVFNTLLDEQTILGLALGAATLGLYPLPEIQYLAYLHNAEDQLRGEAATFSFFSNGALQNPTLVRIAGLAYQKGFGGHFHNDNSLAVLRDIPGISVCVPARADDAIALYRTAHALGRLHGHVVVSVEPIALYHRKDLTSEGDGQWLAAAPSGGAEYGRARLYSASQPRLSFVTYGNGVSMCQRAKGALATAGIQAEVLDLRWIAPLPWDDVLRSARATGRVLVVDESRHSGNVSEALLAGLHERAPGVRAARVTAADCFIPLGDAAELVLVSQGEILEAALKLSRS
ncbi:MAG: MFS transporter [Myxococcales bacterium]|nr:MAG: MFS transporter [Myxococcales bacterium]